VVCLEKPYKLPFPAGGRAGLCDEKEDDGIATGYRRLADSQRHLQVKTHMKNLRIVREKRQ